MSLVNGQIKRIDRVLGDMHLTRFVRSCVERLPIRLYSHARYRFMNMDLPESLNPLSLPPHFELFKASKEDLPLLVELGASFDRSGDWLDAGHELWLLRDNERVVFSVWLFLEKAPVEGAPDGWIPLASGMVNLEDSVTLPQYRGQGLAPAAYVAIFDDLARSGRAQRALGVVPESNEANRRAMHKAGWRDFAVVDTKQLGIWRRNRNWRNRASSGGRLARTRITVGPVPSHEEQISPSAGELRHWLLSALPKAAAT